MASAGPAPSTSTLEKRSSQSVPLRWARLLNHRLKRFPHPSQVLLLQSFGGGGVALLAKGLQGLLEHPHGQLGVDGADLFEQPFIGEGLALRPGLDLHQDVEVVGHDTEGHHPDLAERLVRPHEPSEVFPFLLLEDESSVHDPRDAVVVRSRTPGISEQSGRGHGRYFARTAVQRQALDQ
jgi:hypothetical protein